VRKEKEKYIIFD